MPGAVQRVTCGKLVDPPAFSDNGVMPLVSQLDLRKWTARQSLQTRFLSFSLVLTVLVLVVTHWLTSDFVGL